MPKISVVINTLNEEKNIQYALRSVATWCDEIIVVDMYSDDQTAEIAKEFGAKVYYHERMGYADPARNYAISKATGDWILILDADEIIPQPLSQKLIEIANNNKADVVQIPRLNYLLGAPIMHTCWGPNQDKHYRFFRKGFLNVSSEIHNYLHPVDKARIIELQYQQGFAFIHFNYINSKHFIEKMNRYTTIEAKELMQQGENGSIVKAIAIAIKEFLVRYVKNYGILDGWRGFYLSSFMAFYRLATYAKLKELRDVGTPEEIEKKYNQEAERVLSEYGMNGAIVK